MATKTVKVEGTNAEILNSVREASSNAYQARVPKVEASQASYEQAFLSVTSDALTYNEFVSNLVNLIGQTFITTYRAWRSPLRELMRDYLRFGSTIEEIAIDLFESHNYKTGVDKTDNFGTAFKQNPPSVMTAFHKINHEKYYENTVNDNMLRKAFLYEGGLANFIEASMTILYNSAYRDEYEATVQVVTDNYSFGRMMQVNVQDPTASENAAKALVKQLRATFLKFGFITSDYNKSGIQTFTPPDSIVLLITPEALTAIGVDVLAVAFNMDETNLLGRIITVNKFGNTGIQAVLCDRDSFLCMPRLFQLDTIYDPRHMARNIYLHDHAMFSFSMFTNCVAFTTDTVNDEEVTAVTVSPTAGTITPGGTTQFSATVTGDPENEVYWNATGMSSNDTYIDETGLLHAAEDERLTTVIKVEAYSAKNSSVSGSGQATVAQATA